jgi:hypothetical protein
MARDLSINLRNQRYRQDISNPQRTGNERFHVCAVQVNLEGCLRVFEDGLDV